MTIEREGNMGNEQQAKAIEHKEKPEWALCGRRTVLWTEDDATCSHPDHESLKGAYRRLFGAELPAPLETWDDDGEALFSLLPENIVVIDSYPGNSEIGRLHPPVNGVCCACSFSGEEETRCPARKDHGHCMHWWDGPDGDDPARATKK